MSNVWGCHTCGIYARAQKDGRPPDGWDVRVKRSAVYGRIGDPGGGVTGFARGFVTVTCAACFKVRVT